ncbi:MAG: JAB domain-containing protein [Cyanobacteria bacterium J083]|nr:MAG: JAB domain-containing protein [Cyanobacteria bacterium J083]
MTYNLRIADMPASERPRERLLSVGAKNLTTAELLAILLATGQGKGKLSAVGLAQHLLNQLSQHQREPLDVLRELTPQELMTTPGIGLAKATTILAAIELGKRTFQFRPNEKALIDSPETAAMVLGKELMWQNQEKFAALLLDSQNCLISMQIITIGIATETVVHPREIFRQAIKQGAIKLIVAHNHPSGNLEPSKDDIEITRQLLQGAEFLNIPLLDHLILGNGKHQSLRISTSLWEQYPQMS